ncbi:MAG TPA: riboflavin synthase [Candidatus Dormibacteraeota bacterium]|nr:riboflavin synthase [Candidatus Dormibacteraeota bacterium]
MFSGIVEELGTVVDNAIAAEGRLAIAAHAVLEGSVVGDSVAVNGCCLTLAARDAGGFTADVMPETARRTNLGALRSGDRVNLEASLRYGDRVGGHMVTGHVDATGTVVGVRSEGNALWVTVSAPAPVTRLLVEKGCVAVDGISLTVVDALPDGLTVSLVPHTLERTTARSWGPGSTVNLEADILAKYVTRALAGLDAASPDEPGVPAERGGRGA